MVKAITNFKRLSRISNVLFKEGLGFAVQELDLKYHLKFPQKILMIKPPKKPENMPLRLRRVLESLGGMYVKLGQFLSLRPDLVPKEYCDEFEKLQDHASPLRFSTVKDIIEEETKKPLKYTFKSVSKEPLGSASIAQVHLAKLKNGKKVVIKVQRPRIKQIFESDIDILYLLARRLQKYRKIEGFKPVDVVKEFEQYSKNELNFKYELNNIQLFYDIFKKSKKVIIPKPYPELSSSRFIVMDFIEGKKVSELDGQKYNRKILADRIADSLFKQIFESDIFHADLHPGNVLACKGNKIGLLDFGIIGSLDKNLRAPAMAFYIALTKKDVDEIVRLLLQVGSPGAKTDVKKFKKDAYNIINDWYFKPKSVRFTNTMHRLFNAALDNDVDMPIDLLLLGKALVTAEGTSLKLDPSYDIVKRGRTHVQILIKKKFNSMFSRDFVFKKGKDVKDYVTDLSAGTLALVDKLKRGTVKIDIEDTDVVHLSREIDRSSNRIAYGLIIAAFIVTGPLLVDLLPKYYGLSIYSLISFSLAAFFMFIFVISVIRENKMKY